jgi:hypothetical protein
MTGNLGIGVLEVDWKPVSGGTVQKTRINVSLPVVSALEFSSCRPDREITLEAALLAVARAKREAMLRARRRDFVAAADILENYAATLAGLNLADPELDCELDRLRERAWQLRHRGAEYFNRVEQKNFAYESDMALKGKKEMYAAMQSRRTQVPEQRGPEPTVTITSRLGGVMNEFTVAVSRQEKVALFLKKVFQNLHGAVSPNSYGRTWLLRDMTTGRTFDGGSPWARAQGTPRDNRLLDEVGITGNIRMEILPLPRLVLRRESSGLTADKVRVELPEPLHAMEITYRENTIACDFLGEVYRLISSQFPPNTYGRLWVLREVSTGRVFDCGSSWARANGVQSDIRPIGKIGIRGGSIIQVVVTG